METKHIHFRTETKKGHRDEQVVTVEEPESQQLLTHETEQRNDLNMLQAAGIRPELSKEEAENRVKFPKEELENKKTEIREKRSDLQQLDEEKKKKKKKNEKVKTELEQAKHSKFPLGFKKKEKQKKTKDDGNEVDTQTELDSKTKESSKTKDKQKKKKKEDGNEVDTLKQQLDTHQTELDSKTKEFDDKQIEVQQLQEEIQKKETNLKSLTEKLQSNNKELERSRADLVRSDPVQPDPVQLDPVRPDPVQLDPVRPDPVQLDPVQPDPVQPDPVQPDPVQSSSWFKWLPFKRQELKEELQRREEAENRVQFLEEELQKKTRELQEEKKRREEEVQRKNQELQEKTDQMGRNKDETIRKERRDKEEAQSEVMMLKNHLESKNKEFEKKQTEVKYLKEEIQKMETGLKSLMEDLQSDTLEISLASQARRRSAGSVQSFSFLSGSNRTIQVQSGPVQSVPLSQWPFILRQKFQEKLQKKITERESGTQDSRGMGQNSTTEPPVVFKFNPLGKYIQLINTSSKDQQLGGWDLKIKVNYNKPIIHTFRKPFNLKAGEFFTVGYHDYWDQHCRTDLVLKELTFYSYTDKVQVSLISHPGEIQYNLDRITER